MSPQLNAVGRTSAHLDSPDFLPRKQCEARYPAAAPSHAHPTKLWDPPERPELRRDVRRQVPERLSQQSTTSVPRSWRLYFALSTRQRMSDTDHRRTHTSLHKLEKSAHVRYQSRTCSEPRVLANKSCSRFRAQIESANQTWLTRTVHCEHERMPSKARISNSSTNFACFHAGKIHPHIRNPIPQ